MKIFASRWDGVDVEHRLKFIFRDNHLYVRVADLVEALQDGTPELLNLSEQFKSIKLERKENV